MLTRLRGLQWDTRSPLLYGLIAVVMGGGVGFLLARGGQLGPLAVVMAIGLLVFLIRPPNVAILALLTLYAVQRLGGTSTAPGSSGGVSYSDAVLTGASLLALLVLVGTPELRRLRAPLVGLGVYVACLLPTVVLNPTKNSDLEWVHRIVLVGGAMLVGAWLTREKLVDNAFRIMLLVSSLIALATTALTVRHGFHASPPVGLNKNFVGSFFSVMIVVVLAVPHRTRLSFRWRLIVFVSLALGLAAAQSRGALLTAAIAMFISVVAARGLATRAVRLTATLIAIGIGVAVYLSVESQLNQSSAALNNNALGVRFNVEKVTRQIWRTSPIDGVGLKYFNTGKYGYYAQPPNNVVDNELAESGVIGLVGFVVMQGSVMLIGFGRRGDRLAIVGVGVVVGELAHGMVDIYWSAGVAALPFVILGMGLAERPVRELAAEGSHRADEPHSEGKRMRSIRAMT